MTINIFPVIDIFDLIIILGYLGLVIANGIYASKRVHNIEDFATGGKSYSSFIVFATLSASFIGGGFSLKELLITKFIAPQMGKFKTAQSVGDIMGQLYGEKAKIFTGIASFLVCSGIIGAQFTALGYMTNILLGMDFTLSTIIGACIIMTYTG